MFGRLRPERCSLPEDDRSSYSREYCNLCGTISTAYGYSARLLVVYDFASLAWVLLGRSADAIDRPRANCVRSIVRGPVSPSEADRFLAAISVYACGIKAKDDLLDQPNLWTRCKARFTNRHLHRAETDLRDSGFPVDELSTVLTDQAACEAAQETNLLNASEPTGRAYSLVARHLCKLGGGELDQDVASQVGDVAGRCIYLADAARDYAEDVKTEQYNPLVRCGETETMSVEVRSELAGHLSDWFGKLSGVIAAQKAQFAQRWAALQLRLERQMGFTQPSVTLNMMCFCPCGDGGGGVAADGDDIAGCVCCCGAVCCCIVGNS